MPRRQGDGIAGYDGRVNRYRVEESQGFLRGVTMDQLVSMFGIGAPLVVFLVDEYVDAGEPANS